MRRPLNRHYVPPGISAEVDRLQREALALLDTAAARVVQSAFPRESPGWRARRAGWLADRFCIDLWQLSNPRLNVLRGRNRLSPRKHIDRPEVSRLLPELARLAPP